MLITAVYASTSGNVERVVEKVAEVLIAAGHTVELHRAEKTPVNIFTQGELFILATSTWEHGELNPFFQRLLEDMKHADLTGRSAALIGLGDTRYEPVLFTQGIETIKSVWTAQGGALVGQPLKINGEPYHLLDTVVTDWATSVNKKITASGETTV